ncbi:hypothetical protein OR16_34698 [Cupriavidus basilensis OR16]|uniref:Zona occludens toxin N-terminal domain-containing protein n=1 Tax=Cupriavidus basilensis OR16 TaxID=1127483 RepID=H1SF38_9BURK|nr:zonular occludens toxin domain-containing protein [Cupriavidus basilensis]EHP38863.1 hypothetical protein OR16_34698 [Cupriavidus basilensis OR16]
MTIIFHEGLPGAGKSYEAVVERIIPALQKGRKVFAFVAGLDHEKIANAAAIPLDRCKELLVQVEREQVEKIYDVVGNDSLVVLDEAQNFWPSDFRPLGEAITKFVTEHRHRGLDIVIMGQDLKDVHTLWRRRVDQKMVFTKLDALGKVNKYQWATFKGMGNEKFEKVTSGIKTYDPKFFGTYLSHEAGTENKETFVDKRAVIWSSPLFRRWIPLALLLAVAGLGYVVYMFKGGGLESVAHVQTQTKPVTTTTVVVTPSSGVAATPVAAVVPVAPAARPGKDYITDLNSKWRPRLTLYFQGARRSQAVIEWYDEGFRVKERLYARQIEELGWQVVPSAYGDHVMLVRGDQRVVASSWPIEAIGKTSLETNQALSRASGSGGAGSLGQRRLGAVDLAAFPEG